MTTLISLQNLTKRFGALTALDDVSLEIRAGVTGLLGPNGSGKSTLIKAILGLINLDVGEGVVLGSTLGKQARQIRSRVGYMPEDDCYIAGLSGVDMVCFSARLAGLPAVEGMRRSHEILDFCGIEQERYRDVETYSTGMRQKLKFAQSIVHDPPYLILDEPTSGLDPEERESMLSRIRVLSRRFDKSVLISTHILPDVRAVCDQIVIIANGRVRLQDTLESINRVDVTRYDVRVVGAAETFVEALSSSGVHAEVNHDTITLELNDAVPLSHVWQTAQRCGIAIRSLKPSTTSLEAVFLSAVQETTDASA